MSQAVATVHRESAWLAVDAAFTRLAKAPAEFFAPEVDRYVQAARRTFYDGGLHVADQAPALRLTPSSAPEDPVTALEEAVSALEALVHAGERVPSSRDTRDTGWTVRSTRAGERAKAGSGTRKSDRFCRVRACLVVAAETQRTLGFLPTVRPSGIRLRASSPR